MATVEILRWDDTNFVSKLLDTTDTALINNIDTSGSSDLRIGNLTASNVIVGKGNGTNRLIISASTLFVSSSNHPDGVKSNFGTSNNSSIYFDQTSNKFVFSSSLDSPFLFQGETLSASNNLKVLGTADLPGGTNFALDGVFVTSSLFTAANLSRLFGGPNSNVSDLHTHSSSLNVTVSGGLVQNSLITYTLPVSASAVSGTQVVFMGSSGIAPAVSTTVGSSRVVGIVSGTSTNVYTSGQAAVVYTVVGTVIDGFSSLTGGQVYYLSSNPGQISTQPPSGPGHTYVQVGIAKNSTQLIFQPNIIVRGLG